MNKRLIGIILVGFLLVIAGAVLPKTAAPAVAADTAPTPAHTLTLPEGEQRYIVKYGDGANAEAESQVLEQKGINVRGTLSHAMKASVVVATPDEIEAVKASGQVASVEIDTPVSVSGATSIWGLDRIDQRSGRDGQYTIGDEGAGVDIYIVDTGLNLSHVEFSGRVTDTWSNVADGRGVWDCAGHGTHVAGTAAGTTYGVAKRANIIPVRTLDCNGFGWSSAVMGGIDWAIARHAPGQPAVMNLSVGGFTNASFDQTVQAAINDGITVVAAAGNDGVDACTASPARVGQAITVAATNIWDAQASWSNYGSCVDLQAPGVGIRSAWINANTGYNTMDGTSMATPHVSGAAAILLSRNRSLTPGDVHQTMINNATVGVVGSNKGATPNRLLFIPAPNTGPPSCFGLKPGDAWAGVGTHCGLKAAGTASSTGVDQTTVAGADTPVGIKSAEANQGSEPAQPQRSAPQLEAAPQAPSAESPREEVAVKPADIPTGIEPATAAVPAVPEASPLAVQLPATVEARGAQVVEAPELPAAAPASAEAAGEDPRSDWPLWLLTIGGVLSGALLMYRRSSPRRVLKVYP